MPRSIQLTGPELIRKYIFWIVTIVLLLISLLILKPFMLPIISAFILAYFMKPIHTFLNKKINSHLSAFICVLIILLILLLPLSLVIGKVIKQADTLLNFESFSPITEKLSQYPLLDSINIEEINDLIASFIINSITSAIKHLPFIFLALIITLFTIYSLLVNWSTITTELTAILPFKNKKKISEEIGSATNNIIHGYLLIAFLEFLVGLLGFYISGVKYFLILPVFIAFLAFIPGLGPAVIWIPTAIYYFLNQNYYTAIGVLITGLIISILIEHVLLLKIIGKTSKINPLVFLLGVLGGVSIFGIFGFVIGPLILVYTIKLIQKGINQK